MWTTIITVILNAIKCIIDILKKIPIWVYILIILSFVIFIQSCNIEKKKEEIINLNTNINDLENKVDSLYNIIEEKEKDEIFYKNELEILHENYKKIQTIKEVHTVERIKQYDKDIETIIKSSDEERYKLEAEFLNKIFETVR